MIYLGIIVVAMTMFSLIFADYAPTGCTFSAGRTAYCDYDDWSPPLLDGDFGPGDIKHLKVVDVDGTIPSFAFSGITTDDNSTNSELRFECNLENILISDNVFTENLDWIEQLVFKSCYVQAGITSGMLANLTGLEEFQVDDGIIGPLATDSFSGLSNLKKVIINADLLDAGLPSGLFTSNSALEEIDLKSSDLTSLAADTFTGLESLTTLDLSDNSLTTLPDGLFSSLISLTTVTLDNNNWNCTCDLAWLSTWSLYTGISIDVTCSIPTKYAGVTLGRAAAILGCFDTSTTITSDETSAYDTASSGNSESTDDSTDTLTYIALGAAGFASVVAMATTIALICVCRKLSHLTSALKKRYDINLNRGKKIKRSDFVSTINERPPSYSSNDRIFVQTPIQSTRDSKIHPIMNVHYQRGMPSP